MPSKPAPCRRRLFAAATILIVGWLAFLTFGQSTKWVGYRDLEVCFVVTDYETGQRIPNAAIYVRVQPSVYCDDPPQLKFETRTDELGQAKHRVRNCLCYGSRSRFEDTLTLHLPQWTFHADATGYSATDPEFLDLPENVRHVQRGDGFATLAVSIRLRMNAALPDG